MEEGGGEEQAAILLHHNHYGPFHMGERNFIIIPAGTVKTKLMNTEGFLPRCAASRLWLLFS